MHKNIPGYWSWHGAKMRCTNPSHQYFYLYGGRGISMCERWINSFESFVEDMGERPDGMTIERIDSDGNYEPENCKWATYLEQGRNTSRNRILIVDGVSKPMSKWADEFGVNYNTLRSRIYILGWEPDKALTTEMKGLHFSKSKRFVIKHKSGDIYCGLNQESVSKKIGMSREMLNMLINGKIDSAKGWTLEAVA